MKRLFSSLVFLVSLNAFSLETDQFMTWEIKLKDSTQVVNTYIFTNMISALNKVNQKPPQNCSDVAVKLLEWNGNSTDFLSRIEFDLYKSTSVDKYPRLTESKYGVIKESIYADVEYYKHKIFGVNLQTNNIYYGIDKLGHFLTVGLSYYKKYLKKINANPEDFDDAIRAAIMRGVFSEKTYYGNIISGVFSFADLEANYQGLKFAINLCEGLTPHLQRDENGRWIFTGEFDITNYVNPFWDESYYPNTYINKRWKQVRPYMKKYCEKRNGEIVKERFAYYDTFKVSNASTHLLEELVMNNEIRNPEDFSLDSICQ
jgi:hypothetical protein